MKKLCMVAMSLIVACSTSFAERSEQKIINKERQEITRLSKKELSRKVSSATKKEAKRLKKEGWIVTPGALPLEKQLERSYMAEYVFDANLYPQNIIATAQSVAENYDAAKTAATSLAITNLAGQIQTEVTALVENTVANKQLAAQEAASVVESVLTSKKVISQSIGRTVILVECYRELPNKTKEVMVRLAYNGNEAKAVAKEAVRGSLDNKGEDLYEQLDQIFGF